MAVLFWHLEKITCPVNANLQLYTGQVTFNKVSETHGHVKLVTLYLQLVCYIVVFAKGGNNIFPGGGS